MEVLPLILKSWDSREQQHLSCMVWQKNTLVCFVQPSGWANCCVVLQAPEPEAPTEVWRLKAYYERDGLYRQLRYKEIVHWPPEIDIYKEIVHRPLIVDDAATAENAIHSQFKGRLNLWVCLCTIYISLGLQEKERRDSNTSTVVWNVGNILNSSPLNKTKFCL